MFAAWKVAVAELAKCPNVVAKVGGIQMVVNGYGWHERERPPTSDELLAANARWYRYTIEQFGPRRCMFESNFPVDRLSCSYTVLWNQFKKLTKGFPPTSGPRCSTTPRCVCIGSRDTEIFPVRSRLKRAVRLHAAVMTPSPRRFPRSSLRAGAQGRSSGPANGSSSRSGAAPIVPTSSSIPARFPERCLGVAWSPDDRLIAAGVTGAVKLWTLNPTAAMRTLRTGSERVVVLAFDPAGRRLAAGSAKAPCASGTSHQRVWHGRRRRTPRELQPSSSGTAAL